MDLKDTVDLMLSEDYRDRFKAEYQQVKIRKDKLEAYINKIEKENAPHDCPIALLMKQLDIMRDYMHILSQRAYMYEKIDIIDR